MTEKRKRGRPHKPIPKINAEPEEIARSIFAAANPPDPSLRKPKEVKNGYKNTGKKKNGLSRNSVRS